MVWPVRPGQRSSACDATRPRTRRSFWRPESRTPTIVLGVPAAERAVVDLLRAGAKEVLPATAAPRIWSMRCRTCVVNRPVARRRASSSPTDPTARELEVTTLLAQGMSNREIATPCSSVSTPCATTWVMSSRSSGCPREHRPSSAPARLVGCGCRDPCAALVCRRGLASRDLVDPAGTGAGVGVMYVRWTSAHPLELHGLWISNACTVLQRVYPTLTRADRCADNCRRVPVSLHRRASPIGGRALDPVRPNPPAALLQ